jgi:hypothetical protein
MPTYRRMKMKTMLRTSLIRVHAMDMPPRFVVTNAANFRIVTSMMKLRINPESPSRSAAGTRRTL